MRNICKIVLLGLISLAYIYGQEKNNYYEVPNDVSSILIMNQLKSPLLFEKVQFLIDEKKLSPQISFVVKNKTDKSITSFSVAFYRKSQIKEWSVYGYGTKFGIGKKEDNITVIPSKGTYFELPDREKNLVPLTGKGYELLNPSSEKGVSKFKIVLIAIVEKVYFSDGTSFEEPISTNDFNELFDN